jgi:hypothetical protein
MNKEDYLWWKEFREVRRRYLENDEYKMICEIYARVNNIPVYYPCKCSPTVIQSYIDFLNETFVKL